MLSGWESRSHLKNWILSQDQGWTEFQPADIQKYFEELKRGPNTEIGTKDFFEMASNRIIQQLRITVCKFKEGTK